MRRAMMGQKHWHIYRLLPWHTVCQWVLLCSLIWPLMARAATEPNSQFDAANKLFELGRYSDAIAAYEKLLAQDHASAAVYFNLGNAHFKAGHVGRALASYHLAQRLTPRDPDIRANLRFARETLGSSPRPPFWIRWMNVLSLNELTAITSLLVSGLMLLLAAGYLRPFWAPALRSYRLLMGTLAVISVSCLAFMAQHQLGTQTAIVTVPEAPLRYGPFAEAQAAAALPDGTELRVLGRKDEWMQVLDSQRRTGWVQANDVLLLSGG
jgi:tetratricopeptide (TPR) repeat protein